MTKLYCPCKNEQPDPCPLCGATTSGDDPRRGVCQYPDPPPLDYGLRIVLVDRQQTLAGAAVSDHLGRDDKDFAIEHAGYLADAVERMLGADRSILDAEEWLHLNSLVYEFRKRAKRASR